MSHQPVIDGFEFASAGATQRGILPVREFPRLRDLLASDAGDITYEVEGMRDARGRPSLRLEVRGVLQLRCQRCLGAMPFAVEAGTLLVLAATQAEMDAEPVDPDSPDRILAGKEMRVRDMVEDELILALPYAPRHEHCAPGATVADQGKQRPFADLRSLMRGKQQH
jgi:uncharacterized protein